ncbi:hypothetical protein AX15_000313 [Amanita polypyramis BW_CC]|nr:hypothetical protein AX15_000313 [Amanita polypyramis BW_CC]
MTSSYEFRGDDSLYLPQYGFGKTLDFANLVKHNQFLFRVHTPKERSPFFDDTEAFFIAPRFDERYRNTTPGGLKEWETDGKAAVANTTYQDIAKHLNWTTRSSSPYISTSFSPIWSIWEAVRRHHHGVKQDVEIAIIDANAVSDRAVTTAYLLSKASSQERHEAHWKWFRFSQESQSVLVYGAIPGTAILASVPLSDLLKKLPLYLVKDCLDQDNPFSCLAWDYTERKPNFRLFCHDMSNRFLRLSAEERLQDATTGSVELAIEFLRPWFHQVVLDRYELATSKLCALAYTISQWPCQWWILEHLEIWDLASGIISAIAEDLLEKNKTRDVTHLREAVDELGHTLTEYEDQLRYTGSQAVKYHKLAASLTEKGMEGGNESVQAVAAISQLPTPEASPERCLVDTKRPPSPDSPTVAEKRACAKSLLPTLSLLSAPTTEIIDHPQTPRYFPSEGMLNAAQIPLPPSPLAEGGPSLESIPSLLPALPITSVSSSRQRSALLIEPTKVAPSEDDIPSPSSSVSSSSTRLFAHMTDSRESESTAVSTPIEKSSGRLLPSPLGSIHPSLTGTRELGRDRPPPPRVDADAAAELDGMDLLDDYEWVSEEETRLPYSPARKIPAFVETASYLATGFLVGAFVTLCLFSSHRRTILTNLT